MYQNTMFWAWCPVWGCREGGSRIFLQSSGCSGAELLGRACQGPSSPLVWWKLWVQLLVSTSSRTEELGDDLTPEVPPAWLILPHKMEICIQNSLNPDSGNTSSTCPHSAPALSASAGSPLKGEGPTAPKHTALYRTQVESELREPLNPPEWQQGT